MVGSWSNPLIIKHFDNLTNIKDVHCPVLIIHGTHDTMIKYDHAVELKKAHDATGYTTMLVPLIGKGHNNFFWPDTIGFVFDKFLSKIP